jgi:predicted RNase H-like nuclease (RuvC/YqgF family)
VLSNERQHTDQIKPTYDTYSLEKTDSNTIFDSTNMNHKAGESYQYAEHNDESSSLFTAETFKSNDMVDKEVFNELSNRFLQLEKHCISLEIAMQQKEESFQTNQPCKNPELPDFHQYFMINDLPAQLEAKNLTINNLKNQITKMHEMCNSVKDKLDCEATVICNVQLERKVAELLLENESLKKNCKNLNESIKGTRTKTIEQTTSIPV